MREVRSQFVIFRLSLAFLQPNDIDSGWEADDERGSESEVEVTIVLPHTLLARNIIL